jgi:hypothetical protein
MHKYKVDGIKQARLSNDVAALSSTERKGNLVDTMDRNKYLNYKD